MKDDRCSAKGVLNGVSEKLEIIVRFLAVLELYKQGVIDLNQIETFGDLTVRRFEVTESVIDLAAMEDWENAVAALEANADSVPAN